MTGRFCTTGFCSVRVEMQPLTEGRFSVACNHRCPTVGSWKDALPEDHTHRYRGETIATFIHSENEAEHPGPLTPETYLRIGD